MLDVGSGTEPDTGGSVRRGPPRCAADGGGRHGSPMRRSEHWNGDEWSAKASKHLLTYFRLGCERAVQGVECGRDPPREFSERQTRPPRRGHGSDLLGNAAGTRATCAVHEGAPGREMRDGPLDCQSWTSWTGTMDGPLAVDFRRNQEGPLPHGDANLSRLEPISGSVPGHPAGLSSTRRDARAGWPSFPGGCR